MTDSAEVPACSSSGENSNDTNEDRKAAPAAEIELSQQEIIARNREKALQLRAAKRALLQEPSTLVLSEYLYDVHISCPVQDL